MIHKKNRNRRALYESVIEGVEDIEQQNELLRRTTDFFMENQHTIFKEMNDAKTAYFQESKLLKEEIEQLKTENSKLREKAIQREVQVLVELEEYKKEFMQTIPSHSKISSDLKKVIEAKSTLLKETQNELKVVVDVISRVASEDVGVKEQALSEARKLAEIL